MQATSLKGFHLSAQQARLWLLQGESRAYRVQCMVRLEGELHHAIFLQALQCLVQRHTILRTSFYTVPGMDIPVQVISPRNEIDWSLINLEQWSSDDQSRQLETSFAQLSAESIDPKQLSLVIRLFLLAPAIHVLLISIPALFSDTMTLPHCITEIFSIYTALLDGEPLPEEPLQYIDVAAWQDSLLHENAPAGSQNFWHTLQLSHPTSLHLPQEHQYSEEAARGEQEHIFTPTYLDIPLDMQIESHLHALAQRCACSIESCLLACWQIMLWHLIEDAQLVLGVECNGRIHDDLADAPGLYARFVPFQIALGDDLSTEDVILLTYKGLEQAAAEQVYFAWGSTDVMKEAEATQSFFPLCFDYHSWSAPLSVDLLHLSLLQHYSCIEPFALRLQVLHVGERLLPRLYYDPDQYTPVQIQRLASLLSTVLHHASIYSQTPIGRLPLLSSLEQEYLLSRFAPVRTQQRELPLHQKFEARAMLMPEQLAVISTTGQMTYAELNHQANQLAHILRQLGVGPNILVGLCFSRTHQMLIALLGILKAGGGYVPLDPENTTTRLTYQLQNSGTSLLLTQQIWQSHFSQWDGQVICIEDISQEMRQAPTTNPGIQSLPQDIAYVIYTSGSTGSPKGVVISQHGVSNYTDALCTILEAQPGWHYATVSTLAADLGNTSIFCSLASGGCLQILDYETITSGEAFARWTTSHPIDVLKIVPSHLSALLTSDQARTILPRQALVLGGETFTIHLLDRLSTLGTRCRIFNHYGPTETTIGALTSIPGAPAHVLLHEKNFIAGALPLGRPIENTEAYVLGSNLQVLPVGIPGELYLGGAGLAHGYQKQPEQTAERFIPHPFSEHAGARLYRTGDMAIYTDDGAIAFLGRHDNQVKLRGYRIELGEIESVLRQHPAVWDAAVVLQQDPTSEPRLVAYVVSRSQPAPSDDALRAHLRTHLAEYLLPALFIPLDSLPLTSNGKVDRRQLPQPELLAEQKQTTAMPRSPLEEMLVEIWKDLLMLPSIDIHNDFFKSGGHSLLATQLIARICTMVQVELPLSSLFEAPTIAELAQRVEKALHQERDIEPPPLVPVPRQGNLPLSFAQQRLWFLDQLEPDNTAYLLPRAWRLHGTLHIQALEHSLNALVQRHEILRTVFQTYNGEPIQVILPVHTRYLPIIDMRGLPMQERSHQERSLIRQEANLPCNLSHGPVLRFYLLWSDTQQYTLLLTMHHIISDAWSNDVLFRELKILYDAAVSKRPATLTSLPVQYADYAFWQRQWLQEEVLQSQLDYWRKQLAGVAVLELPIDHPRPPVQTFRGAHLSQFLPPELHKELILLSKQANVTLYMLLLTAFQALLSRYTGQTDISVGSAIANRTRPELEGLIGFFVNTLVLRTDLSGNPSFLELVKRTRKVALEAYTHQNVPFEQLVEEIQPERNLSRSPLFQVVFGVQEISEAQLSGEMERLTDLVVQGLNGEHNASKYELLFYITSSPNGLRCDIQYMLDLFDTSTIQRFLAHWQTLLQGIVASPETLLSDLPLLSHDEQQRLLNWNKTAIRIDDSIYTHQLFEQQAAHSPDAIAISSDDGCLTYGALNAWANRLARLLQSLGVGPDILVGLCMERSLEMILGQLSILKAGGSYLPLDTTYPKERLTFMHKEAGTRIIITRQSFMALLPNEDTHTICLETEWDQIAHFSENNICSTVSSRNLAYVLYTSGSTGQPKGVQIEHTSLINLLSWHQKAFTITKSDRASQFANAGFDASIWEIWPYLTLGASIHIISDEIRTSPPLLHDWLLSRAISVCFVPTPLVKQIETLPWPTDTPLRILLTGGDRLHHYPSFTLPFTVVNNYGPTECTVVSTFQPLTTDIQDISIIPPIGYPIANTYIYLLNDALQLVPQGLPGEMYIGGASLARGYFARPDLTAERFIPHPWSLVPGERLYKTGDLARYLPDGRFAFVGRNDHQVKLRGFRIEPGEIEAILEDHPAIRESVVLLWEDTYGEQMLIAYVIVAPEQHLPDKQELHAYLRAWLPEYMLPSHLIALETLPLTPNGKIDHAALPKPAPKLAPVEPLATTTYTPIQASLASIIAQLLKIEHVKLEDNFFMLGGHSLLGAQVITRISETFGVDLPLRSLFNAPTISLLATEIERSVIARISALDDEEAHHLLDEIQMPF